MAFRKYNFGKCRSCGAKIIWLQMSSGKNMPCNPDKKSIVWMDHGTGLGCVVNGYESHFSTCPNANGHRKSQKKGPETSPGPIE